MCLNISAKAHVGKTRDGTAKRAAGRTAYRHSLVATRDIVVYKVLTNGSLTGAYSPFQHSLYRFGATRTARMPKVRQDYYHGYGADYPGSIEIGLHAFTHKNASRCAHLLQNRTGCAVYPAIIPKGSRLFYGERGEIASDKMIVYRTEADLVKKHGRIGKPVAPLTIAK